MVAAIADVLGESIDALLGRPVQSLLRHEQEVLRSAANLIVDRVLAPPNDQRVATTPLARGRRGKHPRMVRVSDVAATPKRQVFFTDVQELPKREIPHELRARGVEFIFRVDGESMTGAGIQHGDVLYVKAGVTREQTNGRIVVCRHGDEQAVKRLRLLDGKVQLVSENPQFAPLTLTDEEANELDVIGVVVGRYTPV